MAFCAYVRQSDSSDRLKGSKGGETVLENLQILCKPCNIGKSDIQPESRF